MIGEGQSSLMVDDAVLGPLTIFTVKWSFTIKALVEYDADAPLVAASIVRLSKNDFGCHILACPHDTAS